MCYVCRHQGIERVIPWLDWPWWLLLTCSSSSPCYQQLLMVKFSSSACNKHLLWMLQHKTGSKFYIWTFERTVIKWLFFRLPSFTHSRASVGLRIAPSVKPEYHTPCHQAAWPVQFASARRVCSPVLGLPWGSTQATLVGLRPAATPQRQL